MRSTKCFILILCFTLILSHLTAQEVVLTADSIPFQNPVADSIPLLSTPPPTDSVTVVANGIETTIKYYAEDSIITKTVANVTYLYGNAYIEYGSIKLNAAEIAIDRNKNELKANGVQDTTGAWIGLPIFKDGGDIYETKEIRYNFETKRAKISGVATKQQEGYLSGSAVKMNEDKSAFIEGGKYIPCDDPNGTTYIKAKKIKIIPGKKVITGPFLLYIGDIPTPLGLPFGLFPDTKESTSGLIFPEFKSEQLRGLGLQEGGYYFAFNDYIHMALTGDIYSKGSWGVRSKINYKKRYRFSGSLNFDVTRTKTPAFEESPLDARDFWVSWSHRPESRGNGRFSASLNAGSSTYNNNNFSTTNFSRNVRSEFRSNISYSSSIPRTPFSYSVNARHNQNIQTGIVDISLPDMSVSMNRVYPFKSLKAQVLKKLNVGWNFNVTNRISNVVKPGTAGFEIANRAVTNDTIAVSFGSIPELLDNAKNGARHSIPISTSFSILKYLNITPSINFQELWYLNELSHTYLEDQNAVRIDTLNKFSRANTYNLSVGLSTQLYGIFRMKNPRKIEAIRHVMTPSIGFSYRPDYSQEKFGYYQRVRVSETDSLLLSKYDGFIFGSPSLGESASLNFSISNNLEMKVKNDTAESKKVAIIENLSLTSSYNFLADSFNLAPINMTARTSLFNKKLSINVGMTLDPYTYLTDSEGTTRRLKEFSWNSGQGLGRVTSARFSLSTSLNSNANSGGQNSSRGNNTNVPGQETGGFGSINDGGQGVTPSPVDYFYDPNAYVDISVPWNVRLSYDFNYSRGLNSKTTRQAVKAYGQISLTPKWQLTMNSGFDFELKEFTQTSIGIYRDLGCWEMRANWVPFGRFTSYSIDIQIKASSLKDLKLSRRRSFFDN